MSEKPTLNDVRPWIGRLVGNYKIERPLGSGGMGYVYLVRHVTLPDTFLALKVLREGLKDITVEHFKQEAHVANAIGSHRVAKVFDTGVLDDGRHYILMEYVNGRSLEDEIGEVGPFPVERALKIASRVADTLVLAHNKQIVHRDIKPANLMLSQEYGVKLLDFGIARARGSNHHVVTQDRMIHGTLGYIAPECALGGDADGRADVFSLGVVLYEMLAGRLPFPFGGSYHDTVLKLLSSTVPPIASLGGAVPARPKNLDAVPAFVEETIGRALARDPADRLTMSQFHGELWTCLQRLNESSGVPRAPMATMMSTAVPTEETPSSAPTLRAPSDDVAALIKSVVTAPAPAVVVPSAAPGASPVRWLVPAAVAAGAALAVAVFMFIRPASRTVDLATTAAAGGAAPASKLVDPVAPISKVTEPLGGSPAAETVGRIRVMTTPIGAAVFLDGKELGRAPVVVTRKPGTRARLHVELDGYAPHDEVVIFAIDDGDASVRLHRDKSLPVQAKRRKQQLDAPVNPFEAIP